MLQSKEVAPDRDARFLSKPAIDAEYTVNGWRILSRPSRWFLLPYSATIGSLSRSDWLIIAAIALTWGLSIWSVGL